MLFNSQQKMSMLKYGFQIANYVLVFANLYTFHTESNLFTIIQRCPTIYFIEEKIGPTANCVYSDLQLK